MCSGSGGSAPETASSGRFRGFADRAATRYNATFPQVRRVAAAVALPLPVAAGPLQDHSDRTLLWLIVAGVLTLRIVWYLAACRWFPFRRCWCCKGLGRHYSKDGKHLRLCNWWCGGTGRRVRLGRRVWNWSRRHKAST